jgi:hypothetical protein
MPGLALPCAGQPRLKVIIKSKEVDAGHDAVYG